MQQPRAVFLDKDGTLLENVPYNGDPGRMRFLPGVAEGLKMLSGLGFKLIVVTNQSGVAEGRLTLADLERVRSRLEKMIEACGAALEGFYYCPHHPHGIVREYAVDCFCRKPAPGMFLRAARERHLDLEASWMIGDILHDMEAAKRAGCRTILVNNGHETEWILSVYRIPDFVTGDFLEACSQIQEETENLEFLNELRRKVG